MRDNISLLCELIDDTQRNLDQMRLLLNNMGAGSSIIQEDDFDPGCLISTGAAAKYAGVPKDTIRFWAEEKGIGIKPHGRWKISLPLLKKHIGEG